MHLEQLTLRLRDRIENLVGSGGERPTGKFISVDREAGATLIAECKLIKPRTRARASGEEDSGEGEWEYLVILMLDKSLELLGRLLPVDAVGVPSSPAARPSEKLLFSLGEGEDSRKSIFSCSAREGLSSLSRRARSERRREGGAEQPLAAGPVGASAGGRG
jgi:hypothetical protein